MIFTETPLRDAFWIDLEPVTDDRGFFARSYCEDEFKSRGLKPCGIQCSVSFNNRKGTVRGMHYQAAPKAEAKVVRCTRGAVYDVIVDLRPDSPTYRRWVATEMSADNRRAVYIPEGCAHGFQTLTDNTEVYYQMSEVYAPGFARGVRWDDPAFGIEWKLPLSVISERDAGYPDFKP
jgi:dTDP-4-dehydrorhamnose 3,5-epimerase